MCFHLHDGNGTRTWLSSSRNHSIPTFHVACCPEGSQFFMACSCSLCLRCTPICSLYSVAALDTVAVPPRGWTALTQGAASGHNVKTRSRALRHADAPFAELFVPKTASWCVCGKLLKPTDQLLSASALCDHLRLGPFVSARLLKTDCNYEEKFDKCTEVFKSC